MELSAGCVCKLASVRWWIHYFPQARFILQTSVAVCCLRTVGLVAWNCSGEVVTKDDSDAAGTGACIHMRAGGL
jgi:hypothetical protein